MNIEPMEYEPPKIADYGGLVELTAAAGHGTATDATFPAHSHLSDITFSNNP